MTPVSIAAAILALVLLLIFISTRFADGHPRGWRLQEAVLLWHTLTWIGSCTLMITEPSTSMSLFSTIVSFSQMSCTAGAIVALARTSRAPVPPPPALTPREHTIALSAGILSAVVCVAFISTVLRNDQLGLMLASVLTGDGSFLEYRVTMSSGDAIYLAPGYVKQFRDVMLPSALLAYAVFASPPRPWLATALGILGAAAAILSGERSVIMIYVFVFSAVFVLRPQRRARARWIVPTIAGVAVFSAFLGATLLLGRADVEAGALALVMDSAGALFDRVALAVPRENAGGFIVWGPIAPTWGMTWLADLATMLPGTQSGLSNELHDLLGGGPMGSSPLGLPSDTYLAWGIMGVAVVPFLYCTLLQRADEELLRSGLALPRVLRVVLFPLTFAWYSPFLFILNGGALLLAAYLTLRLLRRD